MDKIEVLTNKWVEERPFLEEIASFQLAVQRKLAEIPAEENLVIPDWKVFKSDVEAGIPIFKSSALELPISKYASELLCKLTEITAEDSLPKKFRQQSEALRDACQENEDLAEQIIRAIIEEKPKQLVELYEEHQLNESIVWFYSWTAIGKALKPYLPSLNKWVEEIAWGKGYCPSCGNLPTMAQLKRGKGGRRRHLSCACCKTEWVFPRIGCPYCKNTEQRSLAIFEIEEEPDFRLDVCNECKGYMKTYLDRGNEELMLSDWSTIHLDLLCKEKGYLKMGTPLLKE